jgi:Phosphoribosyl transferase domain
MPLTVCSCVTYRAAFGPKTQDCWTAFHFVNAIKGTPLGGHAQLALPSGDTVRIDRFSAAAATAWFAEISVNALPWRDFLPCALVAIPDAGCGLPTADPPRTFALAEALASQIGPDAVAVDLLRWVRPMPKAHVADGSRDPQVLYGRLRLRDRMWPIAGHRLVLVDDVIATGGHLRAAASFLTDCGGVVTHAVCAARASDALNAEETALTPSLHVLPEFHSDPDWLLPEIYEEVEL